MSNIQEKPSKPRAVHAQSGALRPGLWLVASVLAATLAGCAGTRVAGPAPVEDRLQTGAQGGSAGSGAGVGAGPSGVARVDLTKQGADGDVAAAGRVVYFDFDSYVVRPDAQPVITANGRALKTDARRRLSVEGHTDDRGGREYNLALGQKRANAVVQALVLMGARDDQLEAVSMGKESPAASGSGEEVWAKNRRVELKDK